MELTRESMLDWQSYQNGEVYVIGTTTDGHKVVATETLETEDGIQVLAGIAGNPAQPVPLDSFAKFGVAIEFLDTPVLWDGVHNWGTGT